MHQLAQRKWVAASEKQLRNKLLHTYLESPHLKGLYELFQSDYQRKHLEPSGMDFCQIHKEILEIHKDWTT